MNYIGQSLMTLNHQGAKLKWTPSKADDIKGYLVYMSKVDDQSFVRQTPVPVNDTEWVSEPLRDDMKYFFYITSVDTSGNESDPSPTSMFQLPGAVIELSTDIVEAKDLTIPAGTTVGEKGPGQNFMTSFTIGG